MAGQIQTGLHYCVIEDNRTREIFDVFNCLTVFGSLCFGYRYTTEQTDFSLFETLRESIYSEVATLISQNENRPHFLIELFRELQGLSSDYLRQRVLYSIRDIVNKQLTEQASANTSVMEAVSQSLSSFTVWGGFKIMMN